MEVGRKEERKGERKTVTREKNDTGNMLESGKEKNEKDKKQN